MKLWLLLLTACPLPEFVPDDTDAGTVADSDVGSDSDVIDDDGDGFPKSDDCDDNDSDRFPGNSEICNDGVDQDCSFTDCISAPLTDFFIDHNYPNQSPVSAVEMLEGEGSEQAFVFGNSQAGTEWSLRQNATTLFNSTKSQGGGSLQVVGGSRVLGIDGTNWAVYRPQGLVLDLYHAPSGEVPFIQRISSRQIEFESTLATLDSVVSLPSERAYAALVRRVDGDSAVSLFTNDTSSGVYNPNDSLTVQLPEVGYGPPADIVSLRLGLGHPTAALAHAGDPSGDDAQVLVVDLTRSFTLAPNSLRVLGSITLDHTTYNAGTIEGPVLYTTRLDADDLDDLVVGLPAMGCVYIFRGSSLLTDQTPDDAWHSYCAAPDSRLGWAISQMNDRDGDGIEELVITAPGTSPTTTSTVHVLHTRRLDTPVDANYPIDLLVTADDADHGLGTSLARLPTRNAADPDFIITTAYAADGEVETFVINLDP